MPAALLGQAIQMKQADSRGEPVLAQMVVADFLAQGHFGRHLKHMRALYAARRDAFASALRSVFGDRIEMTLQSGGMHLLAGFPDASDVALAHRTKTRRPSPR